MSYDITNISNAGNALILTQELNKQVNGSVGISIIILAYVIPFSYFLRYGTVQAHLAASFVTVVISTIMFFMELFAWKILAVTIGLFLSALIIKFFSD